MNKILKIILLVFSSLIIQTNNQITNPYGNTCSCSGFVCGTSGMTNGQPCWYNCCWQTMSKTYSFDFFH